MGAHAAGNQMCQQLMAAHVNIDIAVHSEYHYDMCSVHIYCQVNLA